MNSPVKNKKKKINKAKLTKDYKYKFDIVKQYINFSFDKRNTLTPARKAAITRAYNKYAVLEDAGFKFVKTTKKNKKEMALLKQETGKDYKSGKGVFIREKPGIKSTTVSKSRDGEYTIVFEKMAIINDSEGIKFYTYLLKDPVRFALDTQYWIKTLPNFKNANFIRINIGDANFMSDTSYNKNQFNNYFASLKGRRGEEIEQFVTGITLGFLKGKYKKQGYYQRQI